MMRDKIREAAKSPLFRLTMLAGINSLTSAARTLSTIGIDVTKDVEQALQTINQQLSEAAYAETDLDELLKEAQAIGDEVEKTPSVKKTGNVTPTRKKGGDSGKGNFGKSD